LKDEKVFIDELKKIQKLNRKRQKKIQKKAREIHKNLNEIGFI
jgi:hypothetical protein